MTVPSPDAPLGQALTAKLFQVPDATDDRVDSSNEASKGKGEIAVLFLAPWPILRSTLATMDGMTAIYYPEAPRRAALLDELEASGARGLIATVKSDKGSFDALPDLKIFPTTEATLKAWTSLTSRLAKKNPSMLFKPRAVLKEELSSRL